ncbi:MAG: hypothetical protein ACP6IU_02180 [Candidatus Asgardarchaeia archaeon]
MKDRCASNLVSVMSSLLASLRRLFISPNTASAMLETTLPGIPLAGQNLLPTYH